MRLQADDDSFGEEPAVRFKPVATLILRSLSAGSWMRYGTNESPVNRNPTAREILVVSMWPTGQGGSWPGTARGLFEPFEKEAESELLVDLGSAIAMALRDPTQKEDSPTGQALAGYLILGRRRFERFVRRAMDEDVSDKLATLVATFDKFVEDADYRIQNGYGDIKDGLVNRKPSAREILIVSMWPTGSGGTSARIARRLFQPLERGPESKLAVDLGSAIALAVGDPLIVNPGSWRLSRNYIQNVGSPTGQALAGYLILGRRRFEDVARGTQNADVSDKLATLVATFDKFVLDADYHIENGYGDLRGEVKRHSLV